MDDGVALLDEAMVAAVSDRLDPSWAGNIHRHVMLARHEVSDLRRAGEWTEVTARWCQGVPGAGRSWAYLHGEVPRLRGDLAGAEVRYRSALRLGRDPQPGLALLGRDRRPAGVCRIIASAGTGGRRRRPAGPRPDPAGRRRGGCGARGHRSGPRGDGDSRARAYEEYYGPAIFQPLSRLNLRHAAPRAGERVLDVACGTGIVARRVATLWGARDTVLGVSTWRRRSPWVTRTS